MKKKAYAALFSAFMSSCAPNAPRYLPPSSLPSSISSISSPEETQRWLENVISYESDLKLHGRKDFWAPCSLTYLLKKGDCEDYAICAAAILEGDIDQGYIIYVENQNNKHGHAVFAYRKNGIWGINSNDHQQYRPAKSPSLHAVLMDSLAYRYTHYMVFDYSGVDIVDGSWDLEPKMKKVEEGLLR